ncbi:hypothetical protein ACFQ9X_04855 [Catenulispora yoronensis]
METTGWSSGHTVVEIVTDDMPFLVDSVTSELSRQDRGIHVIIHPVLHVRRDLTGALLEVLAPDQDKAGRRCRSSPGSTSRSTSCPRARTPTAAATPRSRRTCSGCCATCARPSRTGRRCGPPRCPWPRTCTRRPRRPSPRCPPRSCPTPRTCCAGWPTTTSPSSASASTTWSPTRTARRACARCPARAWASCAATSRCRRASPSSARTPGPRPASPGCWC